MVEGKALKIKIYRQVTQSWGEHLEHHTQAACLLRRPRPGSASVRTTTGWKVSLLPSSPSRVTTGPKSQSLKCLRENLGSLIAGREGRRKRRKEFLNSFFAKFENQRDFSPFG